MEQHYVPLGEYDWTLTGFGILPWNPTVFCLIAAFFSVSYWLTIELSIQLWFTFKRHRGIYFWSILITTWGIAGHATAYTLKLFVPSAIPLGVTVLAKISWISNTTGFAMVLYSRLGLVLDSVRIRRTVLICIIIDAILFHTPIVVSAFALNVASPRVWDPVMWYSERVMIVGFSAQEVCISSIYTYTTAMLYKQVKKDSGENKQLRYMLIFLILTQIAVFCSDLSMIIVDHLDYYTLKAVMHPFIYSLKLKIEFVVLNRLRRLSQNGIASNELQYIPDSEKNHQYEGDSSLWNRFSPPVSDSIRSDGLSGPLQPLASSPETPGFPGKSAHEVIRLASDSSSQEPSSSSNSECSVPGRIMDNYPVQISKMERQYLGNFQGQKLRKF